jgi:hypothetical protein
MLSANSPTVSTASWLAGWLLSGLCLGAAAAPPAPAASAPPSLGLGLSRERAEDTCTQEPRSQWLPEAEMRLLAEFRGYRIKTFKIANGSCYEIYGFDKDGQIVEVYFNPVTSRLVRQNIAR